MMAYTKIKILQYTEEQMKELKVLDQTPDVPTPFKKALFWPEVTPSTSKIKRKRENIPSVISSSSWQEYNKKKKLEKERNEREKLERKNKREQKKKNNVDNMDSDKKKRKHRMKDMEESDSENDHVEYMESDDSPYEKTQDEEEEILAIDNDEL